MCISSTGIWLIYDRDGESLLHLCVEREQYKTYEKILLAGVDPFITSNKGKTAFDVIMKNNNLKWNFIDKMSKETLKMVQLDFVRCMEDIKLDDTQDFW